MLYPNNTAVRDSIQLQLKSNIPPTLTYTPRSFVMISGGLDSTALLANVLRHTDHDVHAHHIEIVNFEKRATAESQAMKDCLAYMKEHYRPFEVSYSRYEMLAGNHADGPDVSLVMFMAARAMMSLGGVHDIVWTGQLRSPIYAEINAGAIFAACYSFARMKPVNLMPLINFNKFNIYASIPQELADMTWSCRQPRYDEYENAYRCGECHACSATSRARILNESYKNTPDADRVTNGLQFYHTNEESPCLYPRYDDDRNIIRCGICHNCNVLLTRDIQKRQAADREKLLDMANKRS